METTTHGWTILDRDAGVLEREYRFGKNGTARCFVARMGDGKLVAVSPACGLSEDAAADLAEFGELGAIVAPNGFHHLGIHEWRERFPGVTAYAPGPAIARIGKKSDTAGELRPLGELAAKTGDDLHIHEVGEGKAGETWVWAKTNGGHAYFASDLLSDMEKMPPFPISMLFRLMKSGTGYRVFNLALTFMVADKKKTLREFRADVESHPATVVVPAHGRIQTQDTVQADTLAAIDAAL